MQFPVLSFAAKSSFVKAYNFLMAIATNSIKYDIAVYITSRCEYPLHLRIKRKTFIHCEPSARYLRQPYRLTPWKPAFTPLASSDTDTETAKTMRRLTSVRR